MTIAADSQAPVSEKKDRWRGLIDRARLGTGLVLTAFVLCHMLNHAVGLAGLEMMDAARAILMAPWQNPVGTLLLSLAAVVHILIAFRAIYLRRGLRMPAWEAAQLFFGLLIPFLLVEHLLATRVAFEVLGSSSSYEFTQLFYWKLDPFEGIKQVTLLLVTWLHAVIGLHFWLRVRTWYRDWLPLVQAFYLLVPVLSLLGFAVSGREILLLVPDDASTTALMIKLGINEELSAFIEQRSNVFYLGFGAALAIVIVVRWARNRLATGRGPIISYGDGVTARAPSGSTILDASRTAGIPHASVCGGRGRCSTCRVRIGKGFDHVTPPSADERRVLARIDAPDRVRLACQVVPTRDIEVTRLLAPSTPARQSLRRVAHQGGQEREIAILFADIRGFTRFSEKRLPYDVVFVLNRYFSSMGGAVEQAGGRVDKFIGDGVMALFGLETDAATASRQALQAAKGMSEALERLNSALSAELREPLRIGIGIHVGPVIVGEMGYGTATSVTAIGDTVNTASRVEGLTKEFKVQLLVSEDLALRSGIDLSGWPSEHVAIRGRDEPMRVWLVSSAADLDLENLARSKAA